MANMATLAAPRGHYTEMAASQRDGSVDLWYLRAGSGFRQIVGILW